MMNKTCYIVAAGERDEINIDKRPGDILIAADGGYAFAAEQALMPDVAIGDFDSGSVPSNCPIVRKFPCEKDDTDTLLALKYGLEMGYRRFELFCCTGKRLDHTIANIQTIAYAARMGSKAVIRTREADIYAVSNGSLEFGADKSGVISVFNFGDEATGVSLSGLKYPLTDARLSAFYPIGVSNVLIGERATINVKCGTLIVIHTRT